MGPPVEIVPFTAADDIQLSEAARVLFEAMRPVSSAWPTEEAALGEILEIAKIPGALMFVAVDSGGEVRGFIGGRPRYEGEVLELHPLAVSPGHQRRGIGRMLVAMLEAAGAKLGYSTILLGADDEAGQTSLAGIDLYPNPLEKLSTMTLPGGHSVGFYQKLGYAVVGIVPDANGFGKPDILMAKRIVTR